MANIVQAGSGAGDFVLVTETDPAVEVFRVKQDASVIAGKSPHAFLRGTATTEYHVDAAAGDDDNDGLTEGTAFATIGRALKMCPLYSKYTYTIKVYAGTYAEQLEIISTCSATNLRSIDIVGQEWAAVTPATGSATGTFAASFNATVSAFVADVTGESWTTDDLKGKFVKITSGTNNGAYLPIVSNTADTLTLTCVCNGTNGGFGRDIRSATFEIVTPAQIITREGSATHLVSIQGGHSSSPQTTSAVPGGNIRFYGFEFQQGSATASILMGSNATVRAENCSFTTGNASSTCVNMASMGARFNAVFSVWVQAASAIAISVQGLSADVILRQCGVSGGGYVVQQGAAGLCRLTTQSGAFYAQSVDQFYLQGGSVLTCSNGLYAYGTSQTMVRILAASCTVLLNNTSNTSKGFVITGKTTAGVAVQQNNAGARACNNVITTLGTSVVIDSCAAGIVLETAGNVVDLTAAAITNSTGWGVNLCGNKLAGYNQVLTSSATSMSGNGSGDFTLDGSTATSIADLRADGDKDLQNTTRFNRLAEY